jgi:hypothetical protein
VPAAIVLLYLLKPRPRQIQTPSAAVWRRALSQRPPGAVRRRWLLSLLLAISVGMSLALALAAPQWRALGGSGELIVVLDNSPSMAARTRDGLTRWSRAVHDARALLQDAGAGRRIMLLDTMGSARLAGFTGRDAALEALARLGVAPGGSARLPPLPSGSEHDIHVFTDGVALRDLPGAAQVHSVFEPADNVAITLLDARPLAGDPTRYEAFVQLVNASSRAKRVQLLLRGGESFSLAQELDLAAGEMVDATFDVSGFAGGVLRALALTDGDALPADDFGYATVGPHRVQRVLLVTPGNTALEDSLRSLPGMALTTVSPAAYRAAMPFDAYVFDRFAPDAPPAAAALLFRPPAVPWAHGVRSPVGSLSVSAWDSSHPTTGGIAWDALRVRRALAAVAGPATVVRAHGAADLGLVEAGERPVRWVSVAFALQDSNFAMQPGFPVFLGNALRWLTGEADWLAAGIGHVEVPVPHAQVRDERGEVLPSTATPAGTRFEARRAGVYTARNDERTLRVAVNLLDPQRARINDTGLASQPWTPLLAAPAPLRTELWTVLLVLGATLLLVEWAMFTRRITV